MSSVDECVKESILQFPLLFSNRTDVLYHTLCVIGNRREWSEQGDIQASSYPYWTRINDDAYLAEFFPSLIHDDTNEKKKELAKYLCLEHHKQQDELQTIVDNVEVNMHLRGKLKKDIYPQSADSLLMSMPLNVTNDWREACEEMKNLTKDRGWVF